MKTAGLFLAILLMSELIAMAESRAEEASAVSAPAADPQTAAVSLPVTGDAKDQMAPQELIKNRDPFKRPYVAPPVTLSRNELERYPVDSFKMVAVMTGGARTRAMILSPTGTTHLVGENTRIGIKNGVIKRITPEAIEVREKMVNVLGQEETIETLITMKSEPKDKPLVAGP